MKDRKKLYKVIIGTLLVIAAFIIVISFFYPDGIRKLTSGTFGKAEKYRKDQMSEKDIQLRSELTSDTAQLKKMVQGLIYFTVFTEHLSRTIDSCIYGFKLQGLEKDPVNKDAMLLLADYNTFLKNNTQTVANTTRLLASFLLQEDPDESLDIEQNMHDFSVYVDQVNKKDSVLEIALAKIDKYLLGNKTLQQNRVQIRDLKALRDQLLITSTQFMALTGNKVCLGSMFSYGLESQSEYDNIGTLNARINPAYKSKKQGDRSSSLGSSVIADLSVHFSATGALEGVDHPAAGDSRNGNEYIIYDRENLTMECFSLTQLKEMMGIEKVNAAMVGTDQNLGIVAIFSDKNFGMIVNGGVLGSIPTSPQLNSAFTSDQLNDIVPLSNIGVGSIATAAVAGLDAPLQVGFSADPSLVRFMEANPSFSLMVKENGMLDGFENLLDKNIKFVDVVE